MPDSEPHGCLVVILSFFGIRLDDVSPTADQLPYRKRDDFLSAAELSFYRVLIFGLNGSYLVCPKVNLADIFFVSGSNKKWMYRNKIDRKHVDFLLCDPTTVTICRREPIVASDRRKGWWRAGRTLMGWCVLACQSLLPTDAGSVESLGGVIGGRALACQALLPTDTGSVESWGGLIGGCVLACQSLLPTDAGSVESLKGVIGGCVLASQSLLPTDTGSVESWRTGEFFALLD